MLRAQVPSAASATPDTAACQRLYNAKLYREAADCFTRLAAAPANTDAIAAASLLMEAKSLLQLNEPARAEAALRTSLQRSPQTPEALYLLGHLLQQRNAPKASLELYTKAAALQTPTGEDLRIVALDYVLLDSYSEALHWLQRAVAFSPGNAEAWYDLGRAQMHEKRFVEATAALKKSLALRPRSSKAQDNLGICLEAQNDPEAAAKAYATAVDIANAETHPSEEPFVDYGALLNTRNGFQAAVPLLKRATELNPKNSRAFAELSRAYSGTGSADAARTAMERAVALDPGNSRLHFQLGRLYRAAGMAAQAQHEFDLSSSLYGQKSAE